MKQIHTMLMWEDCATEMETTLNQFRVGLNDWDKTKAFDYPGGRVVNYTINCDESTFVSITNIMNRT